MSRMYHSKLSKLCIYNETTPDRLEPSNSYPGRPETLDRDEGMGDPAE